MATNLIQFKRIEASSEESLLSQLNTWLLENTSDFTEEPEIFKSYTWPDSSESTVGSNQKKYYAEIKYKTTIAKYKAGR